MMTDDDLCDFCGAELIKPYWEFEVPNFTVIYWLEVDGKPRDYESSFNGNWFACFTCHSLIIQALAARSPDRISPQEDELAERGAQYHLDRLDDEPEKFKQFILAMVKETHAGFFKFQTGRQVLHK